MDPRAPRQVQIHKLADQPATDQHQTNSKPVFTMKTNPAILISSQKPAYPQLGQDGQISSSIGSSKAVNKSQVWDCGSSLYDSFELNSFNRQLDSVIKASSRTLYLPHLPQRCVLPPTPETLIPVMTITKHQVVVPKKLDPSPCVPLPPSLKCKSWVATPNSQWMEQLQWCEGQRPRGSPRVLSAFLALE
uniref:Uncharacterized protein n=1 Tax=Kalanchoe fedtschenkoi TaxID=63787 RepID=A0A7N0V4B6_KALFE